MAEPRFWQTRLHPTSLCLLPVSWLYGGLEALRRKFTHAQHPGKPVICVGNLTAGGAGKTPSVQWLLAALRKQGLNPAVLSRGYGGSEKGPLKVDAAAHSATQVGDEPLMLAQGAAVYIGADRMASLRMAVRDGHDVLIKDDGFQNPTMAHHFNLIVMDAASGIGNGRLLPAGPLRQNLAVGLEKLDALVLIGAPSHGSLAPLLAKLKAMGKPIFQAEIEASKTGSGAAHGFCGIAKPEKFRTSLEAQGYEVKQLSSFPDHHNFTEADAAKLLKSGLPLMTTEKDMARLTSAPKGSARAQLAARAETLPIALKITEADALLALIKSALAEKQANQLYKSY